MISLLHKGKLVDTRNINDYVPEVIKKLCNVKPIKSSADPQKIRINYDISEASKEQHFLSIQDITKWLFISECFLEYSKYRPENTKTIGDESIVQTLETIAREEDEQLVVISGRQEDISDIKRMNDTTVYSFYFDDPRLSLSTLVFVVKPKATNLGDLGIYDIADIQQDDKNIDHWFLTLCYQLNYEKVFGLTRSC